MYEQIPCDFFEKDNLSLVIYGANDLRLENWPLPTELGPDEVLLQSHSTGICGTDLHLWHDGFVANFIQTKPYCLGHEPSAVVMKCGRNVKHLKCGDNVAIEPAIPCLKCSICRSGRYNLCPKSNEQSHGLPNSDGSLRRYYTHPADFCYKLPNHISLEEGAMIEALAVVVHACRRINISPGETCLVCGDGPIGVMAMLTAKAFGCGRVCITGKHNFRLEIAQSLGADFIYKIDDDNNSDNSHNNIDNNNNNEDGIMDDKELAQDICKLMGGSPDLTIECTGVGSSTTMAINATKYGGRIAVVGLGSKQNVPLATAAMKEVDLIGVCRIKDDYPLAISLLENRSIDLRSLITHEYPIENAIDAFNLLASGQEGIMKVLIKYDD